MRRFHGPPHVRTPRSRDANDRPVFIQELTARSHLVSLSHKRRTLSRPDVAQAISKSDQFDFLIDIVPRDDEGEVVAHANSSKKRKSQSKKKAAGPRSASIEVEDEDEEGEHRQPKRFRGDDEIAGDLDLPLMGGMGHPGDEDVDEVELEQAIQALKHEAEQVRPCLLWPCG